MEKIIMGYPGVGKSSMNDPHFIDLESSCFNLSNNKGKVQDWAEVYVNTAIHLAKNHYVFTSTHKEVQEELMARVPNSDLIIIYPSDLIVQDWDNKLRKRFAFGPSDERDKNYAAYRYITKNYDQTIKDIKATSNIYPHIELYTVNYRIEDLLSTNFMESCWYDEEIGKNYDSIFDLFDIKLPEPYEWVNKIISISECNSNNKNIVPGIYASRSIYNKDIKTYSTKLYYKIDSITAMALADNNVYKQ